MKLLKLNQIIGDKKRGIPPIIPVSRSTWLNGIKSGIYPRPIKVSERLNVWRKKDIEDFLKNLGGRE